MRRGRQRGVALVLVMTVILVLSIIATPFVLSMLLQEKGAQTARCEAQAWYGVDGGRNFAHWVMMNGLDPLERRHPSGPFQSYYYDTLDEIWVSLAQAPLPPLGTRNPRGSIWGVSIQDEQGKLNLRTAPEGAIRRLEEMLRNAAVNPRDFITIYSGRDACWVFPQRIRSLGEKPLPDDPNTTYYGAGVDNAIHYGVASRIRVSKQGLNPFYTRVTVNGIPAGRGNTVETDPPIPAQYADGVIEVEYRHPVNVNTARPEVLLAVFDGLSLVNVPGSAVDRGTAIRLARALAGGRVERLERFLEILAGMDLAPEQKAAVALNAVDPANALLGGTGTVPLTYRTFDTYTFESHASQNHPSGVQVAGRGAREVVSVSPPMELTLFVESQYDFDLMCSAGTAIPEFGGRLGNFPYGNRIITFPHLTTAGSGVFSDVTLKPQQRPGPQGNEAYFQILPASDYRGEFGEYRDLLQPPEHFDDTHEGFRLSGPRTYPWNRVFGLTPPNANQPAEQWPSVAQGGIELWARFDAVSNPMTIFDIREQEWSNRLTLRVENGELILTACDATIGTTADPVDNGAAEIRQPFLPQPETWYHFSAYWMGNHYAGLALLVDGFAHPQQKFRHISPESPPTGGLIARLAAPLSPTSTTLALSEGDWIPSGPTALRIGNEVVVYDRGSGTLARGQRGTNPTLGSSNYQDNFGLEHPAGVAVTLFGYSSKLRRGQVLLNPGNNQAEVVLNYDRLTTGGGALLYDFGENPRAQVDGDKQDPLNPLIRYIDETQTEIPVTTGDPNGAGITEYPNQGYIRIEDEVIFYTDRSTGGVNGRGTAKFTGCTRGCKGTVAARHRTGRRVEMWCLPVTRYDNYLSPTILQVEEEWFGPLWKDPERANFWVPTDGQTIYLPLLRGGPVFGSKRSAHMAGEKVIPTFLVRDSESQIHPPNLENLGRWDVVTITDASNRKEQARVRRVSPPGWSGQFTISGAGGHAQMAAFWDNVRQEYVADDLHTRVLKFPSGELMALSWLESANPNFSIGPFDGLVDEIKFFGTRRRNLVFSAVVPAQAGGTSATIALEGMGGTRKGGLIKAGDEYIGFGNLQNQQLSILKRGWLGSSAQIHDAGDRVLDLSQYVPVSSLQGDVGPTDRSIPIAQRLAGDDRRYRRGYALLDEELVLFEWGGGNGRPLEMPPRWDGTTGLFRGMFGTAPAAHRADQCLVYGLPWRFWDTYKAHEFDNRMVYYQWSVQKELARWRSLSWVQEIPAEGARGIAVHAVVRVDGKGELYSPPGQNDRQLVWEFVNAAGANPIRRVGYQNEAGLFEVRFLVEYLNGAFVPSEPWRSNAWKLSPKIKEIRVAYDRPSITHYHEER